MTKKTTVRENFLSFYLSELIIKIVCVFFDRFLEGKSREIVSFVIILNAIH